MDALKGHQYENEPHAVLGALAMRMAHVAQAHHPAEEARAAVDELLRSPVPSAELKRMLREEMKR